MKKPLSLILFVLLYFFNSTLFAQLTQYFTLVNKTGITIDKVFVAPITDSESWSKDLLTEQSIYDGEKATLSFNKSNFPDDCVWDIKINSIEDSSMSWYDIDLCRYHEIILRWDESKEKAWAELE